MGPFSSGVSGINDGRDSGMWRQLSFHQASNSLYVSLHGSFSRYEYRFRCAHEGRQEAREGEMVVGLDGKQQPRIT